MDEKNHNEGRKTASNIRNKSEYHSNLTSLVEQVHSSSYLHLFAGFSQVALGLLAVCISVMGMVTPFWVSTLLTMTASVVTMLGCYVLYSFFSKRRRADSLIREAIRRIMDAQN